MEANPPGGPATTLALNKLTHWTLPLAKRATVTGQVSSRRAVWPVSRIPGAKIFTPDSRHPNRAVTQRGHDEQLRALACLGAVG